MENCFPILSLIFCQNPKKCLNLSQYVSKLCKRMTLTLSSPENIHLPAAEKAQISNDIFLELFSTFTAQVYSNLNRMNLPENK